MSAMSDQVGGRHYKDLAIQPAEYTHRNKMIGQACDIIKRVTVYLAGLDDDPEELRKAVHSCLMTLELDGHKPGYVSDSQLSKMLSYERSIAVKDRVSIISNIAAARLRMSMCPSKEEIVSELLGYGFNLCEIADGLGAYDVYRFGGKAQDRVCNCVIGDGYHTRLCEIHYADKAYSEPEEDGG